jgi:hypothetical protein
MCIFGKNKTDMTVKSPQTLGTAQKKSRKRPIPEYLVRETIDGVAFYYKGYKEVLNKKKTLEDIMGDSGLQSIIKAYLMKLFAQHLDWDIYQPVCGEVGSHIDHRSNLALDVAIYDNSILTPDKITVKYIDVNPKIVIEIDVRVTLEDTSIDLFDPYIIAKAKKLMAFGTERIIWVFTRSNTIIVAKPGNSWEVFQLNDDVLLLDGISMNIGQYLQSKGIEF